ncbi:MAG: dehypoxanthine futalosine cyclase, partial [Desulfobacterales bacterium]|nr:dehypoxanthine futalosine cyclase [Desulfobacterales bacterium]
MNNLDKIIKKAASNERINSSEALILLNEAELLTLAELANKKKQHLKPEPVVTFVVDRNINYTNICISGCLFCAFYCPPGHADAYVISK